MKIDNEFTHEDIVYLITDQDQLKRIVTGVLVRSGYLLYEVACGTEISFHEAFELTKTKGVS